MDSENFSLTDPEMEHAIANVGMNWSDFFEKEKEKKKMTSFKKEPLELLDEKSAIEYDLRSVKKAGRKTKKKRKSKKRGGVKERKRPPPLAISKEELAATPGEPDEMRRDETEELKAFRRQSVLMKKKKMIAKEKLNQHLQTKIKKVYLVPQKK